MKVTSNQLPHESGVKNKKATTAATTLSVSNNVIATTPTATRAKSKSKIADAPTSVSSIMPDITKEIQLETASKPIAMDTLQSIIVETAVITTPEKRKPEPESSSRKKKKTSPLPEAAVLLQAEVSREEEDIQSDNSSDTDDSVEATGQINPNMWKTESPRLTMPHDYIGTTHDSVAATSIREFGNIWGFKLVNTRQRTIQQFHHEKGKGLLRKEFKDFDYDLHEDIKL